MIFKLTRFSSIFLFGLIPILLNGQEDSFKTYEQKITGTVLSIKLLPIPSGSFMMGSPYSEKGRSADEGPEHKVDISAFWMGEVEITWDLYNLFVEREIDQLKSSDPLGEEVSLDINAVSGATTPYVEMSFGMGTEGYPAINMTQYAASKFCEWLSAITGNFYRLPTEAEWEYACKAGTKTAYSFGNNSSKLADYGWYQENSMGAYHKVGLKNSNPWGLYDMHGNVSEWTLDQYEEKVYKSRKNKTIKNPWIKQKTVYPLSVRGGSWMDKDSGLRSSTRSYSMKIWKMRDPQIPKSKYWFTDAPFIGFRIVRPYETPNPGTQILYWNEKQRD